MGITSLVLLVATLGGIGGLANCLVAGELCLPHIDRSAKVWRPGLIGNIFVGAVAAVVVWGIYGPLASFNIISGNLTQASLTIAQLLSSLLVGLSGGRILTTLAEKQAEKVAKENLVKALQNIITK